MIRNYPANDKIVPGENILLMIRNYPAYDKIVPGENIMIMVSWYLEKLSC